ncbi:MAG: hypothetical protein ACYC8T_20575, partial [Myxococcaceae bacterium]
SDTTEGCVCRALECCPEDHTWLEEEQRCVCDSQSCCPVGNNFDADAGSCFCAGDGCCPKGFVFDPLTEECKCSSSACCPAAELPDGGLGAFRFDELGRDCVCAHDECCPQNHKYNATVGACVCIGDACCPAGYKKDPAKDRCVCTSNAACGPNNVCDPVSGGCRCLSTAGCKAGNYCNRYGFCQSISGCTANPDCPAGTFCDVTTDRCLLNGPCTLDEHCAFEYLCNPSLASCRQGCRKDADCTLKEACISGQCQPFCRSNDACPAYQFCTLATGVCLPSPTPRNDCLDCTGNAAICGNNAACLAFINEGQATRRFCGVHCTQPADCPGGFDCGGVIYTCGSEGASCQADPDEPGEVMTCKGFLVENEIGTQFYCADTSGQPHQYLRSCAPSSGFCPATASP